MRKKNYTYEWSASQLPLAGKPPDVLRPSLEGVRRSSENQYVHCYVCMHDHQPRPLPQTPCFVLSIISLISSSSGTPFGSSSRSLRTACNDTPTSKTTMCNNYYQECTGTREPEHPFLSPTSPRHHSSPFRTEIADRPLNSLSVFVSLIIIYLAVSPRSPKGLHAT